MKVILARDLLRANTDQARQNRAIFEQHGVTAVNLLSSPGAGKTALLEKTLALLRGRVAAGVIEGDVFTVRDAERIASQGVPVVQINTEGICHLDARMVARALSELTVAGLDLLFIENVGNLVCPASFDLGEHWKVAVLSVTEGSDKPAKYPAVFREARAVVISKIDLLPYTDFDLTACQNEMLAINPGLDIFVTSAKTGAGLPEWTAWLENSVAGRREADVRT